MSPTITLAELAAVRTALAAAVQAGATEWESEEAAEARRITEAAGMEWEFTSWGDALRAVERAVPGTHVMGVVVEQQVRVMDCNSGDALDGTASPTLVEESGRVDTGAVPAYRDGYGVWRYVQPSQVEHYRRNLREDVRTVYVE